MIRFSRASLLFARILLSYAWLYVRIRLRGRDRLEAAIARCHTRNAQRLYRGIVRLRGVYIKLGQVLSILGGFLPSEYGAKLQGLQDRVDPHPYDEIRKTFLKDRGQAPEALFATFAKTPIAAASLGQVHRATLADGQAVAVKVLYPNIDRIIRIDLRVLRWVFRAYNKLVPVSHLENIYNQLRDVLSRETDYHLEAQNLVRLRARFEGEPAIRFPGLHLDLCSRRVLVMEFVEGIKITAVEELRGAGIDPTEVARILVKAYYKQLLIDGLYHADPHPGNFLVQPGPVVVFLDFGAVEQVRDSLKLGMVTFLEGLLSRNSDRALEGIETMGFVAPDGNRQLLERTVRYYFKKLVTMHVADYSRLEVGQIVSRDEIRSSKGTLRELLRSVRYPEGFFYIERSLLLLFGVCAALDPKVNALELGFPYAMEFILRANRDRAEKAGPQTSAAPPEPPGS